MTYQIISFDWKEFSKAGFESFRDSLQKFNVKIYLYDLDLAVHKEAVYSSDWILLLSDTELSKAEMKKIWKEAFE